ncbi:MULTISPECIES: 4-(cytidine 5'-diphospho)-2-C-methyl-D-erythritol kinase [unclassified Modicisalibacter]|uniref:4-(cytidine 5'-diphospho)-2-C-methyl-D-erythritol kinase n=1 Tax=unclassified Modicisalibacter TaxID=2679913 RepID=UPI001CCD19FF|nr:MULTISPECIES: 4-(cytidine 5'-diphospho)-2-C-methyl-D-erythritol kinase [unclassified Modicisalibacter]MBZ9557239.1 4-(cytidine 5'-diphospho)-2-C-methyl-D-erythritol kinase [Modicisalibacter sp. R2A 31.J]MBZ9574047.1 4-(cytidine 5'-diphospho)-2-C-methyl-D-erythritol kinase [Modicisalibacter sp. MOD 31.J]
MNELVLPAPAKLNRLLHITGRRDDGYHELQTLFQLLDHGDTLHFRRRDDERISLSPGVPGVAHENNLVVRAARLLQRASGCRLGADIRLDKRLPMGGGLGGGSSNAATALLGLSRLWSLPLDLDTLAALGLELGADVPVFVRGRSAWAEGIGERLVRVALDDDWFVVLHPGVEVATAAVFQAPQLTRDTPPISMARALQEGPPAWHNDCQPTVCRLYPAVGEALGWLSDFAPSLLTGTGACVFCRLTQESEADSILSRVGTGWQAFKARGCNTSPLHQALGLA